MKALVIPLLLTVLFSLAAPRAKAAEVRIAAASNFRATASELANQFERIHGHEAVLVFGSTGKQYAQIVNGAPFDVFLAADSKRPRRLEQAGFGIAGTRFTYALGRLALWSADSGLVDNGGRILHAADFRHFAIANPDLAPYGRAARETLYHLGLWEAIEPRLVVGENIAQTFQFVHSENAELGLVAWPQVLRHGKGSWWRVPATHHRAIEQQALQLDDSHAATKFMGFLRSGPARALIRSHGYGLPDDF